MLNGLHTMNMVKGNVVPQRNIKTMVQYYGQTNISELLAEEKPFVNSLSMEKINSIIMQQDRYYQNSEVKGSTGVEFVHSSSDSGLGRVR